MYNKFSVILVVALSAVAHGDGHGHLHKPSNGFPGPWQGQYPHPSGVPFPTGGLPPIPTGATGTGSGGSGAGPTGSGQGAKTVTYTIGPEGHRSTVTKTIYETATRTRHHVS